jgi:hypothetical protein
MRGMKPSFDFRALTFQLLGTMGAICLVVSLIWWVCYNLNWISQRQAFLDGPPKLSHSVIYKRAPWPLSWLGEQGIVEITLKDPATAQHAHELYPEAVLEIFDPTTQARIRDITPKP